MSFLILPPEINSSLIFSGAGSAPMLSAAAAWDGLAAELGSAADSFSSVTSGLAGQAWQGPASAMVAAAAPYSRWENTGFDNMGIMNSGSFNSGIANSGFTTAFTNATSGVGNKGASSAGFFNQADNLMGILGGLFG